MTVSWTIEIAPVGATSAVPRGPNRQCQPPQRCGRQWMWMRYPSTMISSAQLTDVHPFRVRSALTTPLTGKTPTWSIAADVADDNIHRGLLLVDLQRAVRQRSRDERETGRSRDNHGDAVWVCLLAFLARHEHRRRRLASSSVRFAPANRLFDEMCVTSAARATASGAMRENVQNQTGKSVSAANSPFQKQQASVPAKLSRTLGPSFPSLTNCVQRIIERCRAPRRLWNPRHASTSLLDEAWSDHGGAEGVAAQPPGGRRRCAAAVELTGRRRSMLRPASRPRSYSAVRVSDDPARVDARG